MPLLLIALLLGFVVMPGVRPAAAQSSVTGAIAIIVGPRFSQRDISMSLLRRVFRGEAIDFGGARVVPFNYAPETPVRRALDLSLLGMKPDQVGAYWIDRRIRGQGLPPRTVPSSLIMKAVVTKLQGAMGYVALELADAKVIVLTVDGKHPRSPDYPLRAR